MMSKSPERNTFQKQSTIKTLQNDPDDIAARETLAMFNEMADSLDEREADVNWQTDNMEYDLRTTAWILEKVRGDDVYAQHLYAAICNNEFVKNAVWPLLQDKRWSASWRHAGGIVADMKEYGEYIDWYCSGIKGTAIDQLEFDALDKETQIQYLKTRAYLSESVVSDEIREDLLKLGWLVAEDNGEE